MEFRARRINEVGRDGNGDWGGFSCFGSLSVRRRFGNVASSIVTATPPQDERSLHAQDYWGQPYAGALDFLTSGLTMSDILTDTFNS
jgi:hypothetical protein